MLLALPALGVGWFNDDLLHRLLLEDRLEDHQRAPWQLYDFTTDDPAFTARMRERGYLPWFTSTDLSLRFFRPLSSLSLAADHVLFGRDALLAHIHSLAWFVVLLVFVGLTLRRVLRPTSATMAIALYGIAGSHAMTTAWVAARHSLVGAAFGAISIWAHVGWRQERERWRGLLAPLALIAGMLSSETALGAVVFVVLYELLVRRDAFSHRVLAATPLLTLGLVHLVYYVVEGYGVRHSAVYIMPSANPAGFAVAVLRRLPMLAAELYGALPIASWVNPAMHPILIVWGLGSVTLVVALILGSREQLRPHEHRHLAWLGTASLLCLVPMVGGFLGGRLLPLAQVGATGLLATAMMRTWMRPVRGSRRWLLRGTVVGLALVHVGMSFAVRLSFPSTFRSLGEAERRLAENADPGDCERAYLLTGADPTLSLYAGQALAFFTPETYARLETLAVLSMAPQDQRVTVLDDRSFELEMLGTRRSTPFEGVYTDAPPQRGDVIEIGELTATVLDTEAGLPTRVRFEVRTGLEGVCLVRWDGERLVFQAPDSATVPHVPGPMSL